VERQHGVTEVGRGFQCKNMVLGSSSGIESIGSEIQRKKKLEWGWMGKGEGGRPTFSMSN
jgi:hypothetical protein